MSTVSKYDPNFYSQQRYRLGFVQRVVGGCDNDEQSNRRQHKSLYGDHNDG